MVCTNCGREIKMQAKFCSSCGTPVEKMAVQDNDKSLAAMPEEKIKAAADREILLEEPDKRNVENEAVESWKPGSEEQEESQKLGSGEQEESWKLGSGEQEESQKIESEELAQEQEAAGRKLESDEMEWDTETVTSGPASHWSPVIIGSVAVVIAAAMAAASYFGVIRGKNYKAVSFNIGSYGTQAAEESQNNQETDSQREQETMESLKEPEAPQETQAV